MYSTDFGLLIRAITAISVLPKNNIGVDSGNFLRNKNER
ncbi:hypothetical protein GXM_07988 [Nostoc sphaeroides CCNUC1]|uniref:Uncharacterized protein n=1 Tax=Nostoc sphaeroides CCNUC1 TaxID=2653204 RepID=A0A5P8WCY7_9NOSO|nr:hypothetical protein GXM_07988 [Nostoc sphaeroides CCNUC1]